MLFLKSMDISQIFNSIEMFFWLIIGAIFFVNGFRQSNQYKKLSFFLSVVFAAFGLSDGIEVHTGAWWRPWWLLLWKVLCVIIFVICLIYYIWHQHRLKTSNNPQNEL